MTNKTPSGVEKHHESTEPESITMAKMFFFFFKSLSSLRQASSTLCEPLA